MEKPNSGNQIFERFGCVVVYMENHEDFKKLREYCGDHTNTALFDHFASHQELYPLYVSVDSPEEFGWMEYTWRECGEMKFGYEYYLEHYDYYTYFSSIDELFGELLEPDVNLFDGFDCLI